MKTHIKKNTIKQQVLDDFIENKKEAEGLDLNYFPTGLLKYYLFNGNYLTYAGRIIGEYCKENNIQIIRAGKVNITNWQNEIIHQNTSIFIW